MLHHGFNSIGVMLVPKLKLNAGLLSTLSQRDFRIVADAAGPLGILRHYSRSKGLIETQQDAPGDACDAALPRQLPDVTFLFNSTDCVRVICPLGCCNTSADNTMPCPT